ncbi:hypothetical protein CKO27_07715 [Thiocystis violacea]|nr:hypothetical protein [Thiocystis violacea]
MDRLHDLARPHVDRSPQRSMDAGRGGWRRYRRDVLAADIGRRGRGFPAKHRSWSRPANPDLFRLK